MHNAFQLKTDFPGLQTRTYGLPGFYTCEVIFPDGLLLKGLGTTLALAEDAAYHAASYTLNHQTK